MRNAERRARRGNEGPGGRFESFRIEEEEHLRGVVQYVLDA